jgi:uncharacterized membrane protein YhaH (DUF805 family)
MNLLFGFSGRIGRLQWWLAQLAILGVLLVGFTIVVMSVGATRIDETTLPASAFVIIGLTLVLTTWINIASTVKRFHDRDKSGYWFFIVFVPYVGAIWQIVECGFLSGSYSINRYGPPPGSGNWDEFEDEVRATYAQPSNRLATAAQSVAVAPQQRASAATSVPMRRSVPASGFGRRGAG